MIIVIVMIIVVACHHSQNQFVQCQVLKRTRYGLECFVRKVTYPLERKIEFFLTNQIHQDVVLVFIVVSFRKRRPQNIFLDGSVSRSETGSFGISSKRLDTGFEIGARRVVARWCWIVVVSRIPFPFVPHLRTRSITTPCSRIVSRITESSADILVTVSIRIWITVMVVISKFLTKNQLFHVIIIIIMIDCFPLLDILSNHCCCCCCCCLSVGIILFSKK
mmetsp:Transcript_2514/g.6054  ORF Transcript_2514/g.6054 Transcript_2514/m.6054 type:complete len:220 (-) Transcript_2514:144-803(-)